MTNSLDSLISRARQNSIGFDDMISSLLQKSHSISNITYPPLDMIADGDHVIINIAVAGFQRKDLSVLVDKGYLHIEGSQDKDETNDQSYIRRGISKRPFQLSWRVSDNWIVEEASYIDGILSVTMNHVESNQGALKIAIK